MNNLQINFIRFYKPYRLKLALVLLAATIAVAINLAIPLIVRHITTKVLPEGPNHVAASLAWFIGALIVMRLVQAVMGYYQDVQGHILGSEMERDMRSSLFKKLQQQSFSFFDRQRVGSLMSHFTTDLFSVTELAHHAPEDILIQGLRFAGSFFILVFINLKLTLAVFALVPILLAFMIYFNKRLNRIYAVNKQRMADINAQLEDSLAGIKVVQAYANYNLETAKFETANEQFLSNRKHLYRNEGYLWDGTNLLTGFFLIILLSVGGWQIAHGTLQLADLLTYILYVDFFIEPMHVMTKLAEQYQEGITGFERFVQLSELQPEITDSKDAKPITLSNGEVRFDHVSFHYRDDPVNVLEDLNVVLHPGEFVALVGGSGEGKSTLSALIPRFYDVTSGAISVDGTDIRDVTLQSLRENIGFVQQETYLFFGTIMENIRYGNLVATDDEVIEVARLARLHDFIVTLPNGYQTQVGERGVRLSGGQRQRVSLARLFLKQPKILIFDEATSSLDNETERWIQKSIRTIAKDRTTLVIAHRLSTIIQADRILVLDKGRIVEEGSHADLVACGGIYANLYSQRDVDGMILDDPEAAPEGQGVSL